MKKITSGFILLSTLFAGAAQAEGPAIFATLGQATYDGSGIDESDTSFAIGAEYRFNPNFSVDGRYEDFGEIDYGTNSSASADAFSFSVKGGIPIGEQFNLYAKIGMSFWGLDTQFMSASDDYSGEDFLYGFGGEFAVSDSVGIGAEYTMLTADIEDNDLELSNLALTISFKF